MRLVQKGLSRDKALFSFSIPFHPKTSKRIYVVWFLFVNLLALKWSTINEIFVLIEYNFVLYYYIKKNVCSYIFIYCKYIFFINCIICTSNE